MTKRRTTEDTLLELWTIKDETARRFRTAAKYFQHLGLKEVSVKPSPSAQPSRTGRPRSGAATLRKG